MFYLTVFYPYKVYLSFCMSVFFVYRRIHSISNKSPKKYAIFFENCKPVNSLRLPSIIKLFAANGNTALTYLTRLHCEEEIENQLDRLGKNESIVNCQLCRVVHKYSTRQIISSFCALCLPSQIHRVYKSTAKAAAKQKIII